MSIQVENGNFARIHNEISERLARTDLSGAEFRCLWFLLRKTYGFQKKQDQISYAQFADGTGIERRSAIRALDKMIKRKIIYCIENGNNRPQTWGFNKYFEHWDHTSDENDTSVAARTSDQIDTSFVAGSDQNDTTSSDQIDTKTSDQIDTHNRYKDKKDSNAAPPPFPTPKANEYLPGLPDPRKRQSQARTLATQTSDIAKPGVEPKQFRLIVDEILRGMGKLELADHDERTLTEAQDVARCLVALDVRYKTPDGVKFVFDTWYGNNEFNGKAPYASQVKSYASQILAGKVRAKAPAVPVANWSAYGGGVPDYMRE
jgi:phage replication O-like protein O